MDYGYLVMYPSDRDEIHAELVDKTTYDKVCAAVNNDNAELAMEELSNGNIIQSFMTQTMCIQKWPYNNINIVDTVCIWMY